MKIKQEELTPKIEPVNMDLPSVDITALSKDLEVNTILDTGKEDEDSFFKAVVTQLFNNTDVETKSYNTGIKESFYLARLSFIGERCLVPNYTEFVKKNERKRISIDRKGRGELVYSLSERQQEIERQRLAQQKAMLGGV